MQRSLPCVRGWVWVLSWLVFGVLSPSASADTITLRSGLQFSGKVGKVGSLDERPLEAMAGGEVDVKQIVVVDDDLRRTFVASKQVLHNIRSEPPLVRIRIPQRVSPNGKKIGALGAIIRMQQFDQYGRRIVTLKADGAVDVLTGITEITPIYTKVEALQGRVTYVWDSRIATSSIPAPTLSAIIRNHINPKDADERLKIVKLFIQSERISDAHQELQEVINDFPNLGGLQGQVNELRQKAADRMLKEIEFRREAGQHRLAFRMLQNFPVQGVAGQLQQKISELLNEYRDSADRAQKAIKLLDDLTKTLANPETRKKLAPMQAELAADVNLFTFDRLADFVRLADDESLQADQKVSLAISGWLLGGGSATENLAVSLSLIEVRELVRKYLQSTREHERQQILEELRSHEGSEPNYLAKLIAQMKPPIDPGDASAETPGFYELKVPGLGNQADVTYYVQLPIEYDPHRRYPCVVTLNGSGTTPQMQIDWWAGAVSNQNGMRVGQATRRGYIVIAPQWAREHQRKYEYSAREHAAVMHSLRDACRRFSIDTDRVFLSGHSMGGDAAWDIGLAHPDLWAGVAPIVATADKFVSRYWENGRGLPMYFVCGGMDGKRMATNAQDFDHYLTKSKFDCIVVEYQGRGHEHFPDEVQRIFDWMNFQQRNFFPKDFKTVAMRPWDNYFWWVELDGLPPRSQVLPEAWPPPSGTLPARTDAKLTETNGVIVTSSAERVTLWLSPEMLDFEKRISISVNGKSKNRAVTPTAGALLEDVRTRGDRQHPFWVKVDTSGK